MIDWTGVPKEEHALISQVARRGYAMFPFHTDYQTLVMDITAAHIDVPMRLDELLEADAENFAHDIGGIVRHIDRDTGKLKDCFVPRFAR